MWLQKLPGFKRTPYGVECRILRRLPLVLFLSLLVPALVSLLARVLLPVGEAEAALTTRALEAERLLHLIDYLMIGMASLLWYLIAMLGMGCVIVWLMKGPAYVADGFDFNGSVSQGVDSGSSPG
jgi:hypothetical protein